MTAAAATSIDPVVAARVAAGARLVARAGLAEGFGHVSHRLAEGSIAITPTAPLADASAEQVLMVGAGDDQADREGLPLETPMHAAVYAARPEVGAVVRVHPASVVVAGVGPVVPPVTHGLGGLSGELALHGDPQLVTDRERAEAVAGALGAADCVILRANGALSVAATLERALVQAWFLEERARVWLRAGRPEGMSDAELAERARHWPSERERAWRWLERRFGDGGIG